MKSTFVLAMSAGFGGTLAAGHFVPWFPHARLPSHTSVVANGGRAEQFLIRLPADRIAATGAEAGGLRSAAADERATCCCRRSSSPSRCSSSTSRCAIPPAASSASRHGIGHGRGWQPATTWSLLIPSRGAMLLTASGRGARRARHRAAREPATTRASVGRPGRGADDRAGDEVGAVTRRHAASSKALDGQLHGSLDRRRRRRGRPRARHRSSSTRVTRVAAAMKYLFVALVGLCSAQPPRASCCTSTR